jgi:hypothetical protein
MSQFKVKKCNGERDTRINHFYNSRDVSWKYDRPNLDLSL